MLATGGDTHLGGDDFDQRIVEYAVAEFKKSDVYKRQAVAAAQGGAGHIPDIGAGHLDAAAVHIIETHQQIDEGGLAAVSYTHLF